MHCESVPSTEIFYFSYESTWYLDRMQLSSEFLYYYGKDNFYFVEMFILPCDIGYIVIVVFGKCFWNTFGPRLAFLFFGERFTFTN